MITNPMGVLAVLLLVLALLFSANKHPVYGKIFRVIPLLVFCYFVPTLLSNTGVIPLSSPLYTFIKKWLLPVSLFLLTLSVDIPGILKLGKKSLILFLGATGSIVIGGPLAYAALGWLIPVELRDQAWRGLAALAGSWIGGGANFIAMGTAAEATDATLGLMVIVDVAVASTWMAVLLYFAGREKEMDAKIGADRKSLDELREKVAKFQADVARPTDLASLLMMCALAFGATFLSKELSKVLTEAFPNDIVKGFIWVVILVTTAGVVCSFTKLRRLEGAGASALGSVFLYLLVAVIGASGDFAKVVEAPSLVAVGALWMFVHCLVILGLRLWVKAPVFMAAVGSQANVGGAASAPIVASAFHPALATVGILLAVGGYVLGTYMGLVCTFLLKQVHLMLYAS